MKAYIPRYGKDEQEIVELNGEVSDSGLYFTVDKIGSLEGWYQGVTFMPFEWRDSLEEAMKLRKKILKNI